MNSKQLQYAIALSESLSFSQVAQKLGISQPALSKQISHLEQDLGVKLFERNPLSLTPAGKHFLKEARQLLYREDQLLRSMEEYKSGKRGSLTIGVSPFRSLYLIPPVAEKLQERFPHVEIRLVEAGSDQLRKEAAEGKFDLAVVNLPVDESVLEVTPIQPDTLVLAVPKTMLSKIPQPEQPVHLKDCKDLPFIAVSPSQEMRRLFDQWCAAEGFRPRIALEVVGLTTAWSMVRAGTGVTLLPLQFAQYFDSSKVALLPLKQNIYSRQPVIVTRKRQYLSEYARCAIHLLTKGNQL